MNKEEVLKLAKLARIDIPDSEAEILSHEFEAILGYVSEIKEANTTYDISNVKPEFRNVMREDTDPHESGIYTETLLTEAPKRKGDYVEVKKIL